MPMSTLAPPKNTRSVMRKCGVKHPLIRAAESTASALALHLAIEAAGTVETAAVRDALNALDAATFYGPINFDETGKNSGKANGQHPDSKR